MNDSRPIGQTVGLLLVLVFVAGAVASPPDPFSQIRWFGVLSVASLPIGWWLVFRDGYRSIGAKPPGLYDLVGGGLLASLLGIPVVAALSVVGLATAWYGEVLIGGVFVTVFVWGSLYGGADRIRRLVKPGADSSSE